MAYTKYSLTPANNNAAPPDGAPEGMLPSAVNDTMRDMMSQIRDCGDGIRGGTYTMTAPVITGGSINGAAIGASSASTGAFTTLSASSTVSGTGFSNYFASPPALGGTAAAAVSSTNLSYTGTLTGGTGVVNLGSGQFYKDASGNVGIGTNSPNYKVGINGSATAFTQYTNSSTGTTTTDGLLIGNDGTGAYIIQRENDFIATWTNNTERMRIDSSGNLLVGYTARGVTSFDNVVAGNGFNTKAGANVGLGGNVFNIQWTGNPILWIDTTNIGQIATVSDYRLKENVTPQTAIALERIMQLQPVKFNRKAVGIFGGSTDFEEGFLAHELQAIIPSAVTGDKDALTEDGTIQPQSLNWSPVVSVLVKAIQEQQVMIEELKAKVAALESA